VIAVDQDPTEQGRRLRKTGDLEIWVKRMAGNARAVVLFNRGGAQAQIALSWQELGLPFDAELAVRDLWAKKDLGKVKGTFVAAVPSHDVVMVKLTQ
jgi:alpha-galactosidase